MFVVDVESQSVSIRIERLPGEVPLTSITGGRFTGEEASRRSHSSMEERAAAPNQAPAFRWK